MTSPTRGAREEKTSSLRTGADLGVDNVPRTMDNTFRAQIIYNPFDWLGGRLKYQKLYRDTDTEIQPITPAANAVNIVPNNITRFDIGKQNQDMFKLTADITPTDTLNVSLEYAYKLDDYNSTILGMQKAEENEFILDGSYVWKGVKFFAFFDYDVSYINQTQRTGATDPSLPPPPQPLTGMPTSRTTTMRTA